MKVEMFQEWKGTKVYYPQPYKPCIFWRNSKSPSFIRVIQTTLLRGFNIVLYPFRRSAALAGQGLQEIKVDKKMVKGGQKNG